MDNNVTRERLESVINEVFYTQNGKTTICVITTKTGFQVVGTSSCVDSSKFNKELGQNYSFKAAMDKLEELETYRLSWELHNE